MKSVSFLLLLLLVCIRSFGQEEKTFFFNGYLKDMVTFNFPGDSVLVDNLVHNRLNFRWEPSDKWSTRLELRNRLFFGDVVGEIPNYGEFIDVNNDYFDLSWTPINENGFVAHTMIDRMSVKYAAKTWNLTVGRQRINWGVNLVWNPNDIFNAYSFFDFDYEERPGSDAIRFQKFTGFASGYEIAITVADDWKELTAAGLYQINVNGYDIQALGGVMENNAVIGTGWAGNIEGAGFKGELTYFQPFDDDQENEFLGSISIDYSFANSLYVNGSLLYDSRVNDSTETALTDLQVTNLDVRSLSPFHWSTFLQASYTLHPLISGGVAAIYYPGESGIFLNPNVTWSILSNLDLDAIGQLFVGGETEDIRLAFLRLKYSF